MSLAEEVAGAKLAAAYPFRDEPREDQVLQRVRHAAAERGSTRTRSSASTA